ncbi:MAG: 30S ribosomal protein S20 [Candidatus Pacebacteria bacterium]|nr:30S ribosomal protein S20 [Candidatus Paceibacterota bacterium]
MPILANAKKALRASKRKAAYNQRIKSRTKTQIDQMKAQPTEQNLAAAYQAIDKCVKRNIWHQNKAARRKSQLAKLLNSGKKNKK